MKRFIVLLMFVRTPAIAQLSPAPIAELDSWHEKSLGACGNDIDCDRITKQTYDDALACVGGNSIACSKRDKNIGEINRWNAERHRFDGQRPGENLEQWWARWKSQNLESCDANENCRSLVNRIYEHHLQCARGNQTACNERTREEGDWNAGIGGSRN